MTESLQLIDESKTFSPKVYEFLDHEGVVKSGLNYHLVSVFGSQSTGKSTLLNALFGTKFNVMDEAARKQTTKGIWMAKSQLVCDDDSDDTGSADSGDSYLHVAPNNRNSILVLDVEGTDGRERGEDQDFERKSALFALATSEVLIVNMWENQVGLYQGANMGLLKTVFEVNLNLFHASKQTPRSLILFVIRDHIGTTPLANLSQTLLADLTRAWESISKPESLQDSTIDQFFDIKFEALPHKVLMPEKFTAEVDNLARKFSKGYFKPEYHRNVPLDGWDMYGSNVWQQIEENKDLDLPTQQVLVARFRCGEIAAQAAQQFETALQGVDTQLGNPEVLVNNFGALIKNIRSEALKLYDSLASRYTSTVYQGQRLDLVSQMDSKLSTLFSAQLAAAHKHSLERFDNADLAATASKDGATKFGDLVNKARDDAMAVFARLANEASSIDKEVFLYSKELAQFTRELNKRVVNRKQHEIDRIVSKGTKKIGRIFDDELDSFFTSPDDSTWDNVMKFFNSTVDLILGNYTTADGAIDFGVDASTDLNASGSSKIRKQAWKSLDHKLKQITMPSNVLSILQDQFDKSFRYDKNNVPIVWTAMDDIETPFKEARDGVLKLVPIFATAYSSSQGLIKPDVDISPSSDNDDTRELDDDEYDFSVRLSTAKKNEIIEKFKRQSDAAFVDAKRSTTQSATEIPWYMFVLLIVLGWNEFMAVLRNPFLFVFVLLLGGAAWVTFTLGMWGPMLSVSSAMYTRALELGKEKLRDVLEAQQEQLRQEQQRQSVRPAVPSEVKPRENIELSDLSKKEE